MSLYIGVERGTAKSTWDWKGGGDLGGWQTLGWRTFVGAGTTGFLGVTALAVALGSPVVTALAPAGIAAAGRSSLLAVAGWVPLTEELCKQIPVAFVVIVALRRAAVRPSADAGHR